MLPMFEWPLRVYMEDTDAGGIVYYANYLKFFERARSEWLRTLGFNQQMLMEEGVRFVVRDLSIRYRQPAMLDEQIIATVEVTALTKAGMTLNQRVIRRSDSDNNTNEINQETKQEVLAEAEVRVACIDDTGRPMAIPRHVAEHIQPVSQEQS